MGIAVNLSFSDVIAVSFISNTKEGRLTGTSELILTMRSGASDSTVLDSILFKKDGFSMPYS